MSESVTATRVRVPIATYTLSTQLPICTRRQVLKKKIFLNCQFVLRAKFLRVLRQKFKILQWSTLIVWSELADEFIELFPFSPLQSKATFISGFYISIWRALSCQQTPFQAQMSFNFLFSAHTHTNVSEKTKRCLAFRLLALCCNCTVSTKSTTWWGVKVFPFKSNPHQGSLGVRRIGNDPYSLGLIVPDTGPSSPRTHRKYALCRLQIFLKVNTFRTRQILLCGFCL